MTLWTLSLKLIQWHFNFPAGKQQSELLETVNQYFEQEQINEMNHYNILFVSSE